MPADGTPEAAQAIVRELVEAAGVSNRKSAIARAARAVGIGCRRITGLLYGEAKRLDAREWIALTNARIAARKARIARLRAELDALNADITELESCAPVCAWQPEPAPSPAPRSSGFPKLRKLLLRQRSAPSATSFANSSGA